MTDENPKDAIGRAKPPMSPVPANVLAEIGMAMAKGAAKYGRHNWRRAGIAASVYYDAALRHLFQWWEGEDVDPDSGLSHVVQAIAGLTVLRDAMARGMVKDDRPEPSAPGWLRAMGKPATDRSDPFPPVPTRPTGPPLCDVPEQDGMVRPL